MTSLSEKSKKGLKIGRYRWKEGGVDPVKRGRKQI